MSHTVTLGARASSPSIPPLSEARPSRPSYPLRITIARLDAERGRLRGELDLARRAARDASSLRRELAAFLLMTIALFAAAQVIREVIHGGLSPLAQMGASWGFLAALFGPVGWFLGRQPMPLAARGVTLRGARESLGPALALGLAMALACVALRVAPALRGEPLFTWASLARHSRFEAALFVVAYGPHCLLQEFIARGVVQTSLERLLPDAGRAAPVAVTSLLFGAFHLYVSPAFALVTFAASALFGALYARHRTLAGVTLAHALAGFASVAVGLN